MGLVSGVATTVNGVLVGATDFSEFSRASGLPAGITEYGIGVGSPSSVAIRNDPVEGNYFESLGTFGGGGRFGFGLDGFDGQIEFGELLARVWINVDPTLLGMGPCMCLSGFVGFLDPDMEAVGGMVRRQGAIGQVWDSAGVERGGTTTTFIQVVGPMQEVSQQPEWAWIRVRRTANLAVPSEDDWKVTSWFGDFEDEPANPDVEVDGTDFSPQIRNIAAIGWFMSSGTQPGEQRIAFLSYTADPLIQAPPVPNDLVHWVPSNEPLGSTWVPG